MDQFVARGYYRTTDEARFEARRAGLQGSSRVRMARPGLRVLVTRPFEESESLAAALASRGVAALVEPLIQIRFSAPQALDLAGVQAVLFTSANGVRALARAT